MGVDRWIPGHSTTAWNCDRHDPAIHLSIRSSRRKSMEIRLI